MSTKSLINLPNFDNVGAGSTALCSLFIGPRYHKIVLDFKESGARVNEAAMEAAIEEIVLKINSVEQIRIDPATLFDLERSYNPDFTVQDGVITLILSNRMVTGQAQQEGTALGTLGVSTVELEVKIASSATSPTLKATAEVDYVQEAPNLVRKISKKNISITGTGDYKESIRRRGASYRAIHFFETTAGDIENIRLQYEGQSLVDHDPVILHASNEDYGYSAASKQVFLPLDKGVVGDALASQVRDANGNLRDAGIELTLNMGAAQDVTMVEDFYGLPNA